MFMQYILYLIMYVYIYIFIYMYITWYIYVGTVQWFMVLRHPIPVAAILLHKVVNEFAGIDEHRPTFVVTRRQHQVKIWNELKMQVRDPKGG
jgi:hypothetical protein